MLTALSVSGVAYVQRSRSFSAQTPLADAEILFAAMHAMLCIGCVLSIQHTEMMFCMLTIASATQWLGVTVSLLPAGSAGGQHLSHPCSLGWSCMSSWLPQSAS